MRIFRAVSAPALARLTFILTALVALCPQFGLAQSIQTPTPAQLETFRNLSPDQQQAVLEAMGGRSGSGAVRHDAPLLTPQLSVQRIGGENAARSAEIFGPPRIGANSTVLLEVLLPGEVKPAAVPGAIGAQAMPNVPGASSAPGVSGAPNPAVASAGVPPPSNVPVLDPAELERLTARRDRILSGNPYELDGQGRIALPELPPIVLSGLTDQQAAQRLSADPRLSPLQFIVTILPVEPVGTQALQPFGYDMFDQVPTTFALASDIPVPSDYRIGPGDNITIDLYGKKSGRYQLVVDRSGALSLPELGPIQVAGLTFDELRSEVQNRISEQMIGVSASVTMGQLRSIGIFVVGDVVRPGNYTVSGLSTITNALFASGGVSQIGSLRNIELKRGGRTVAKLDLYDLLLRGDTSQDQRLRQGDAIFVPPIGSTAGIAGQVRRPAIYEFRDGATIGDLINLSGGLKPQADPRFAHLERIGADRERAVIDFDLSDTAARNRPLLAGDILTVPQVLDDTRGLTLEGYVHRPGAYAWREGMRLTDLLGSLAIFKLNADQRYVLIRREHMPSRRIEVLSADAVRAFEAKGTEADPLLQSRDRIIVFNRQPVRGAVLDELMREMRMQARDHSPEPVVSISGRVRSPGNYPLETHMTVGDLIRAGGGMDEAAYAAKAELTRYEVVNGQSRKTEVIEINLASSGAGSVVNPGSGSAGLNSEAQLASLNMPLHAYDVVVVKETPDWREQESITLTGEVRFPGKYPIRYGETLSSVIERAGGLTEAAFPQGSVFLREELKDQERQQVERLANRLQSDLALVALQTSQTEKQGGTEMLAVGQSLLTQLKNAAPTGRLVIDLERALANKDSEDNLELRGGDQLIVPRFKPYVTVIGEVQNATSHVWKENLGRDDYIKLSGGTTRRADGKRIYVVRANGSVDTMQGSRWFGGGSDRIEPGDTIVVPLDAERMRPLPLWTAVTTIIYNLAVAVAAVNSF